MKILWKFNTILCTCASLSLLFSCASPVQKNEKLSDEVSSIEKKVEDVKPVSSNDHPLTVSIIHELIPHIPNHGYLEEDKIFMTDRYYNALVEAWKVPSDGLGGIGSDEWLWYFLTGNGGASDLLVRVDDVSQTEDRAKVQFSTAEQFEDDGFRIRFVDVLPSSSNKQHLLELEYSSYRNRWVISNFDNTLTELEKYPVEMRKYFSSDKWIQDVQRVMEETSPDSRAYLEDDVRKVNEYLNRK